MHKRAMAIFIFMTVFTFSVFSQDKWNRYAWGTPEREGFTVLLPFKPSQISKDNGEQGLSAQEEENSMDSYGSSSAIAPLKNSLVYNAIFQDGVSREEYEKQIEKWMNLVAAQGSGQGTGSSREEKARETELNQRSRQTILLCGFSGVEFGNSNSVQRFFLVEGRLYHIWVIGADKTNPDAAKFLKSFTLVNPWENWKGMQKNEPLDSMGIGTGTGIRVNFESSVCQNIGKTESEKIAVKLPRNTPLRLISKPPAKYPEESKKQGIQGTISLRVVFLKDGAIGSILVVKGINKEMNDSAISSAKLIKFEPQQTNGKPVSTTKTIEYNFTIY